MKRIYEATAVFNLGTDKPTKKESCLVEANDPTKALKVAVQKWSIPDFKDWTPEEVKKNKNVDKGGFFVKDSIPDQILIKKVVTIKG